MAFRGASAYQIELASSELANKALAIEAERISYETAQQRNQANQKTGQAHARMQSMHDAQQAMQTEGLLLEAILGNNQSDMQVQQMQLQEARIAIEQATLQIQKL